MPNVPFVTLDPLTVILQWLDDRIAESEYDCENAVSPEAKARAQGVLSAYLHTEDRVTGLIPED